MTKILFIGGNISDNKGGTAIVLSASNALKRLIPDAEFALTSIIPERDSKNSLRYSIRIVPEVDILKQHPISNLLRWFLRLIYCSLWNIIIKLFGGNTQFFIGDRILKEYFKSDIILEISGDGLSGDYGFYSTCLSLNRILACVLLKKLVVIYAQSIGPFNIKWPYFKRNSKMLSFAINLFARSVLNNVALITVREDISLNNLKALGISRPEIYLTADSAFLLVPSDKRRINQLLSQYGIKPNERIVGLSISKSINMLQYNYKSSMSYAKYKEIICRMIEYVTDKLEARILIIPQVTGPAITNDDRIISKEVYESLEDVHNVVLISEDLFPEDLKGIIGICNLFIGSRMHASIAALSMAIPTIAIGYSHKTWGIMKMMGQENFIFNLEEISLDNMFNKIDLAWENREEISRELKNKTEELQRSAFYNAILVNKLLSNSKI